MFTIKVYDKGSMDYTAFSAAMYRREFVRYQGVTKDGPDSPLERLVIFVGDEQDKQRSIEVHGCAFVENAAGKTIERIGVMPGNGSTTRAEGTGT